MATAGCGATEGTGSKKMKEHLQQPESVVSPQIAGGRKSENQITKFHYFTFKMSIKAFFALFSTETSFFQRNRHTPNQQPLLECATIWHATRQRSFRESSGPASEAPESNHRPHHRYTRDESLNNPSPIKARRIERLKPKTDARFPSEPPESRRLGKTSLPFSGASLTSCHG